MDALDYDACAFSADGRFLAAAVSDRLFVKRRPFVGGPWATALAAHRVDRLQWNGASDRVLCAQLGSGSLQVYDVRSNGWTHTVRCGYFGFIAAEWMGRSKILLTLEFCVALAVFDLFDHSMVYVEIPKPVRPCVVFDNDGTCMFVISKINGHEKLLMMHSQSLDRIIYTEDMIGPCECLNKSPDDRFLIVFNKQKLAIFNFSSGNIIGSVDGMSLNTVSWAPDGKYVALGCSSGTIIVLDSSIKFNVKYQLCLQRVNEKYDFFIESDNVLTKSISSTNFICNVSARIDSIAWSYDCRYLSTFEVDSTFLCIWKTFRLICVIKFSSEIKTMQWCQSENKLSVAFGTDLIFFWAENQIPELQTSPKLVNGRRLLISSIFWSFNNKDMILSDGKKCILFSN